MRGYYTYLLSSLPTLHFGAKPPFPREKFFAACEGLLSGEDLSTLKTSLLGNIEELPGSPGLVKRWRDFEIALRNELVKIRASRKHIDANRFLREDGYADSWITHIAANAHRTQSIIEAEKMLDQERWCFLDELSLGHYFDLESLIVYGRKLFILERWDKIRGADSAKLLEEAVSWKEKAA